MMVKRISGVSSEYPRVSMASAFMPRFLTATIHLTLYSSILGTTDLNAIPPVMATGGRLLTVNMFTNRRHPPSRKQVRHDSCSYVIDREPPLG